MNVPTRPAAAIPVCASQALQEGGLGVRFELSNMGHAGSGFVVRHHGRVHGYLNRCAHAPVELDWEHGRFFDGSGVYLMCASHGAIYAPESGLCVGGPCKGGRLRPLAVFEQDGQVWWLPDAQMCASASPPAP